MYTVRVIKQRAKEHTNAYTQAAGWRYGMSQKITLQSCFSFLLPFYFHYCVWDDLGFLAFSEM